jgi:hypothetical protein
MDYLISFFIVVGIFFAGVLGNILAYDFCQFTPKICRRLIERAAKSLVTKIDQDRYAEEWLAHLSECTTIYEQYRHAVTVVRGARKLRRLPPTFPVIPATRIDFANQGSVDLDSATSFVALHYFVSVGEKLKRKGLLYWILPSRHRVAWIILAISAS